MGHHTRGTERSEGSAPLVDVDDKVVRRAQRGDPAALEAVVRCLAPYVGRICGAIALAEADDAMQEAMMAIVVNLRSLRDPAAVRGWARRIAVREAIRASGGGRTVPVDPAGIAIHTTVPDSATATEIRDVLESLAPEQRAVLVLRHVDGLGEDEMAAVLDVAPGTVKSRLHRARAAFRARWSE